MQRAEDGGIFLAFEAAAIAFAWLGAHCFDLLPNLRSARIKRRIHVNNLGYFVREERQNVRVITVDNQLDGRPLSGGRQIHVWHNYSLLP
ncbi:hypothetical protein GCM10027027_12710 [Neomicrococcus lactis]